MRINIFTDEGVLEQKKTAKGSTLVDYLALASDPVSLTDAANKKYADDVFENLNTSAIQSGIAPASALPSMRGDVVSAPGTTEVNLKPITSAGTYITPTVNEKGLVTGSGQVSQDQVPYLDWSIIKDGLPNTVSGYGIQDAISTDGGNVNFNILLSGDPTTALHAATKKYVNQIVATGSGNTSLKAGDVIVKGAEITPYGYLRCNGGFVPKASYPELYAVLGGAFNHPTNSYYFILPDLVADEVTQGYYYIKH